MRGECDRGAALRLANQAELPKAAPAQIVQRTQQIARLILANGYIVAGTFAMAARIVEQHRVALRVEKLCAGEHLGARTSVAVEQHHRARHAFMWHEPA